jgi:endonuclease YncB( thermonuclease family)
VQPLVSRYRNDVLRLSLVLSAALYLAASAAATAAGTISGRASVIDGDTLEVNGISIRLDQIDAPEIRQTCTTHLGKRWPCGEEAAEALYQRVRQRVVHCVSVDLDRYGRTIGRCTLDGRDLGAWMVQQGWALAFRRFGDAYVAEEREAERARRGMWSGRFIAPWDWRRGLRD